MATWLQHIRLQFGGSLGGGIEEWSNTVKFKLNADDAGNVGSVALTASQLEAALAGIEPVLKAWFQSGGAGIHQAAQISWAKLNMVGTNGKQLEQVTHLREWTPVGGGLGGTTPPFFVTLALTMRTAYTRGRGNSGRIFPPMIAIPIVAGGGYISEGNAAGAANSWAACLDGVATAINEEGALPNSNSTYAVIGSPATTIGPDPGGPVLLRVTGVVVDRVHDVQHRRTDSIPRAESTRAPVNGSGDG